MPLRPTCRVCVLHILHSRARPCTTQRPFAARRCQEAPAPALCADRGDYFPRDLAALGMLPRGWGAHYLNCLTTTTTRSAAVAPPLPPPRLSGDGPPGTVAAAAAERPAAASPRRLALSDGIFVAALCRRTLALDRTYYSHPANLGMCVACL